MPVQAAVTLPEARRVKTVNALCPDASTPLAGMLDIPARRSRGTATVTNTDARERIEWYVGAVVP